MAANADDAGAGVVRRAEPSELSPAHRHDMLHRAQGLDVVHDGGTHIKPQHGREVGWLNSRVRALALERLDQPGLLTTNVSPGAAMNVNLEIVTAAENILPEEIFLAGFL